jgi:hypothetical protein
MFNAAVGAPTYVLTAQRWLSTVTGVSKVACLPNRGRIPRRLRLQDRRQDSNFAGGPEGPRRARAVQIATGSLGTLPRAKVPPSTMGDARLGIWDQLDVSFRRRRRRYAPAGLRSFPPCRCELLLSGVVFHFASYPSRILLRVLNRIRRNQARRRGALLGRVQCNNPQEREHGSDESITNP